MESPTKPCPSQSRARSGIRLRLPLAMVFAVAALSLGGCVTKRTTTRDGVVVDQEIIVKRPIKNLFKDARVE